MGKHTQGPWNLKPDGEANFFTIADSKQNWLMRIQHNGEQSLQEQTTNANLIAAAPELLEALKEVISIVKIHSEGTKNNFAWAELDYANEIIKKAVGEKQ
jgi:hypothetical protein